MNADWTNLKKRNFWGTASASVYVQVHFLLESLIDEYKTWGHSAHTCCLMGIVAYTTAENTITENTAIWGIIFIMLQQWIRTVIIATNSCSA